MYKVDYIIVGSGLAGLAFSQNLIENSKSFILFDRELEGATDIALGVYNPVVLKRFTPVWKADEQLKKLQKSYNYFQSKFQKKYLNDIITYRIFASIYEQNLWLEKSDNFDLVSFLDTCLVSKKYEGIYSPFGFGSVNRVGRLDIQNFRVDTITFLKQKKSYLKENFDYGLLQYSNEGVSYKQYFAKYVIFCEGFGLKNNPYFNDLPLVGNKGEWIKIYAPKLSMDAMIKSKLFIYPLKEKGYYIVGATFDLEDKTSVITEKARQTLIRQLVTFMNVPFKIVTQKAGIRPTVIDRRPLVGVHQNYSRFFVLNGLGTRGVMIAPYVADKLYRYIEYKTPLPSEIDIKRFN